MGRGDLAIAVALAYPTCQELYIPCHAYWPSLWLAHWRPTKAIAADGLPIHLAGRRHPAASAHTHPPPRSSNLPCPKVPVLLSFDQALPPAYRPLLSKVVATVGSTRFLAPPAPEEAARGLN